MSNFYFHNLRRDFLKKPMFLEDLFEDLIGRELSEKATKYIQDKKE